MPEPDSNTLNVPGILPCSETPILGSEKGPQQAEALTTWSTTPPKDEENNKKAAAEEAILLDTPPDNNNNNNLNDPFPDFKCMITNYSKKSKSYWLLQ